MKNNHTCTECHTQGERVKTVTLRNQLKFPHNIKPLTDDYYYCTNPNCTTAYFSNAESYRVSDLQTEAQIRNKTVCFCFGITEQAFLDYVDSHGAQQFYDALDDLAYNTKCHCKFKNPAGKGCLRKFKSYSY